MDKPLPTLDWTRVQTFLAVAEAGSLSGAARQLGLSQPTLGRQIRMLEDALGVTLFTRQPRGLALTEAGAELLPSARSMQDAARGFALTAAGRVEAVAGTVRITASDVVALKVLPEILAEIRRKEPDIEIEIAPSDRSANLLFREADIALRMYRPDQLDIVTRHLGDVTLGLYGARSYFDRRGRPTTLDDIRTHDLIGYDRDETLIRGMRALGLPVDRHWFGLRCDDHNVLWELVRAGCGLCFAQIPLADADPTVEQVLPELPLPTLPIWLTAHEAMRRTPRIRRVWDLLAEGLAGYLAHGTDR